MWNAFIKSFLADLRQMLPFHILVAVHAAAVLSIVAWHSDVTATAYRQYATQFGPVYFLGLPALLLLGKLVAGLFRNPKAPLAWMTWPTPTQLGRLAGAATVFASLILFMGSFTTFKTLMPMLRGGFLYDRAQADLDAFFHGGVDPGLHIMTLLGNPRALAILQWNYSVAWTAVAFVSVFFVVL